jgi:hypothetical protein
MTFKHFLMAASHISLHTNHKHFLEKNLVSKQSSTRLASFIVPANLLVVFLLVELYKLGGARSSKILCPVG